MTAVLQKAQSPGLHFKAFPRKSTAAAAPQSAMLRSPESRPGRVQTQPRPTAQAFDAPTTPAKRSMRFVKSQRDRLIEERDEAQQSAAASIAQLEEALDRLMDVIVQRDRALSSNRNMLKVQHKITQERNEARERNEVLAHQRDQAVRKLSRAVTQRDKAIAQLDKSIDQRDKVLAQLDRAILQRDKAMTKLDKALEQRAQLIDHFEQARHMLVEWKEWRVCAQQALDETTARAERAEALAVAAVETPGWAIFKRRKLRRTLEAAQPTQSGK